MIFRVFLPALVAFFMAFPAWAAPDASTEHVHVTLLADKASVAPGDTLTLALVQDIVPEWHTYWRNPGDSGIPPSVIWTLPPGTNAGPLLWPAPQRLAFGPLVNFGYSTKAVLLTEVEIPKAAAQGDLPITANFNWLVCQDSCIPESAKLDIVAHVGPISSADSEVADVFSTTRASLPVPAAFQTDFVTEPKTVTLHIGADVEGDVFFFPYRSGLIDNSAPQIVSRRAGAVTLSLARGELKQPATRLEGVLQVSGSNPKAYAITAMPGSATAAAQDNVPRNAASHTTLIGASLLALLGGMLLNLMPCVFPVLSLKVLALARHAHDTDYHPVTGGLAYTAGVLVAFGIVGGVLLGLRAAGNAVGWGFQMQSPSFVLALAYLMFAMALSLSGVFEVGGRFIGAGSRLAALEGKAGSFFTGALAAVAATPCSAPFMGTGIGFALAQPWPVALAVIECLGLGLALPYLALSLHPSWTRFLPRPGAWMEKFKQFLAFPLYASAAWLIWVLSLQAGPAGMAIGLGGLVLVAFTAWVFATTRDAKPFWRALASCCVAASIVFLCISTASPRLSPTTRSDSAGFIPQGWEPFSASRLAELRRAGKPVFVDMSAAWCISCMMNERVALTPSVTSRLAAKGIVLLKGDWTNQDPAITAYLETFNRNGVPLYVFYPDGQASPIVLPQILTPRSVLDIAGQ